MARRKNTIKQPKEDPPDIIPDDVVNSIVFFRTQRLPKEKQVRIEVNAVDSPHRFFFNWLGPQYQSLFMETMDSLQFDYRSTNQVYAISKKRLRMGMACVVKYSNVFFRGVIIDVNDDFVEVFTIDYGKKVITFMENYGSQPIFWMRRKFKNMPCQAIPGQLYTLFPKGLNWTQESADFLLEQLADKEVIADVARYELPGETVSMSLSDPDSGEMIELSLVNSGHAEFVGEKGLEMIDNEAVSQRIVDHFDSKRKAEEASGRKTDESEVVSLSVPPGFEAKVREPARPVTFDNMLEALEASSSCSSSVSCGSQEDLHTVAEGLSPSLLAAEELSAAELPTALVRPSVRSESCAVASSDKDGGERCEAASVAAAAAAVEDEVDESASSCAGTVDHLLSIDASKIVDPQEKAWLREELQREMERLRVKLEALDLQILRSIDATHVNEASGQQQQRHSSFNPEAAPFVPRALMAIGGSVSAESTASSGSVRANENALLPDTEQADAAEVSGAKSVLSSSNAANLWPGFVPEVYPVTSVGNVTRSAPAKAASERAQVDSSAADDPESSNVNSVPAKNNVASSLQAANAFQPPTTLPPNQNSVPFATSYFEQFAAAPPSIVARSVITGSPKPQFLSNRMSPSAVNLEPPPGLDYPPPPYGAAQVSQASLMVMPPPGFLNASPVYMPQFSSYTTPATYYSRQPPWSFN